MSDVKLVSPCPEYLESYRQACRELKDHGGLEATVFYHDPDAFEGWKDTIFQGYENNRLGIGIPEGYVPQTSFWLVEDGEFIASGNIRHRLSPSLERFGGHIGYCVRPSRWRRGYGTLLLELLLREARAMGIERALLTCEEENIGSALVMEKNGGVYQDTIENVIRGKKRRTKRYWIDTGSHPSDVGR